jgi:Rrf2 family protein
MLRMSTKGHHATRIMIFLANHGDGLVTKTEIAEAETISSGYLQQLLIALVNAGLVKSFRGKAGGFMLGMPAETITVRQVLAATEGPFELAPCLEEECSRAEACAAHLLWFEATRRVNDLFDHTTVADLVKTTRALQEALASVVA